jgi:hypothetical protein
MVCAPFWGDAWGPSEKSPPFWGNSGDAVELSTSDHTPADDSVEKPARMGPVVDSSNAD